MAAERTLVDLQAVASGTKVPYSTLCRWAKQRSWTVHERVGLRKMYDIDVVLAAVKASKQQMAA